MPDPSTPKSGIRTTEFWLTAAAASVGFLVASGQLNTTWQMALGSISAALAAVGYAWSRSRVKTQ